MRVMMTWVFEKHTDGSHRNVWRLHVIPGARLLKWVCPPHVWGLFSLASGNLSWWIEEFQSK